MFLRLRCSPAPALAAPRNYEKVRTIKPDNTGSLHMGSALQVHHPSVSYCWVLGVRPLCVSLEWQTCGRMWWLRRVGIDDAQGDRESHDSSLLHVTELPLHNFTDHHNGAGSFSSGANAPRAQRVRGKGDIFAGTCLVLIMPHKLMDNSQKPGRY